MSAAQDAASERPSKSARKRAAHAAQELGEELLRLPAAALAGLDLPAELVQALREARGIVSRAAGARQRQYIGKLMRALDLAPIRAALEARAAVSGREVERLKRVERWRARLLADGSAALAELAREHPGIDRAAWAARVSAAQAEQARSGGGRAARELFRALRALLDTMP
jgi:ribosome-associated protein